ncbi:hypothetical protein AB0B41_21325, partial [Pseudonocardia sp. NPDC049154]
MDDRSPPEEGWIHDLREGSFHEDRAMESAGAAPRQLALSMAELARDLYRAGSSEQVVDRVLGACVELVDGCAEAGVSLRRSRDRIETPATTGELARSLDALQDELQGVEGQVQVLLLDDERRREAQRRAVGVLG